ncbi:MAG: hypothetical protein KJ063_01075 [Anaerolineae bacterium]|nr:hypothetical protein [Anaerolineae bacterium]
MAQNFDQTEAFSSYLFRPVLAETGGAKGVRQAGMGRVTVAKRPWLSANNQGLLGYGLKITQAAGILPKVAWSETGHSQSK